MVLQVARFLTTSIKCDGCEEGEAQMSVESISWSVSLSAHSTLPTDALRNLWNLAQNLPSSKSHYWWFQYFNFFLTLNSIILQTCTAILSFCILLNVYSFLSRRNRDRVLDYYGFWYVPVSFSENPVELGIYPLKYAYLFFSPRRHTLLKSGVSLCSKLLLINFHSHFSKAFSVPGFFDKCILSSFYLRAPSSWWKLGSQISWHLEEETSSGSHLQYIFLWWVHIFFLSRAKNVGYIFVKLLKTSLIEWTKKK